MLSLYAFFFNDPATTEIYTLSLHDALPIFAAEEARALVLDICRKANARLVTKGKSMIGEEIAINDFLEANGIVRSEEHTSELQSRLHLVCRLLLEKKKTKKNINNQ